MRLRTITLAAAMLAATACGRTGGDAAADSAAIPNTSMDSTGKTGPVGDSLSSAAGGALVTPGADTARADTAARRP
ncbi:hypothetical protein [Roseisolibacter sp. H3M3-2]|uniref:hypothetical protein n=1 Tax=Roseisolibacter sp. H3M3-2 TaxID=3031323 RepID=UPI0023DC04FC|nr:hypothetical protein [Roseisolibacter sp. H3M3-2]MDF1505153.1 hypothetical protein [Roseisolibacter sp. H3M3-2]